MGDFARLQKARKDADGPAAPLQDGVGHGAHESDAGAAVHEGDPPFRQRAAEPCGGFPVHGGGAFA